LVREDFARCGVGNLEAVELGLRRALLQDGRHLLEELLRGVEASLPGIQGRPGEKCHIGRSKPVQTIFGEIELRRRYFYDQARHAGRAPLDEALGLRNGFSPGLVRLATRAAAREGYEAASQDLLELAAIRLEGRQIQRLVHWVGPDIAEQLAQGQNASQEAIATMYIEVDGTGVPMVADELAGRKGKQPDGTAKTREVKLGAVFTQTQCDEEGKPERDYGSTTYTASFAPAEAFGLRVREEARRRGLGHAQQAVFLGDGAAWVWELQRTYFPQAIPVLDLYHALEHLHQLCDGLYGAQSRWAIRMEATWTDMLLNDQVAGVITTAKRRLEDLGPKAQEDLSSQIDYFERHQHRMCYKTYRQAGLFYGSGVIEAGCKAVIGQRLKNSGMFWTQSGAQNILELRCALKSNRWQECWDRLHDSKRLSLRIAA
jgi:hypothetical protein